MSLKWGRWGLARWGYDRWGCARAGVMLSSALISAALLEAFTQDPATHLSISATITVGGVDYSAQCSDFEIHSQSNGQVTWAKVAFFGATLPAITCHQTAVSITINYALSNGATFSGERFRGTAHLSETRKPTAGDELVITCYDDSYPLTTSRRCGNMLYSGSAIDLINYELSLAGFPSAAGTFVDLVVNGVATGNFGSSMEMIVALANARRPTYTFWHPNGNMVLTDYADVAASGFTAPLAGQSEQTPAADGIGQVNQVPFSGTMTYTYNDTADQALNGVLPHRGVNTFYSLAIVDMIAIGAAIVGESQKAVYDWVTPLNPFLFPGGSIVLTLKSGGTATVRVEEVVDTGKWPGGFWSSWKGRSTT